MSLMSKLPSSSQYSIRFMKERSNFGISLLFKCSSYIIFRPSTVWKSLIPFLSFGRVVYSSENLHSFGGLIENWIPSHQPQHMASNQMASVPPGPVCSTSLSSLAPSPLIKKEVRSLRFTEVNVQTAFGAVFLPYLFHFDEGNLPWLLFLSQPKENPYKVTWLTLPSFFCL